MTALTVTTGVFPSAASVHVWHAQDAGLFAQAGLEVDIVEVRSSDQQLELWDSGALTVMHTAPDHLLRGRQRDPVVLEGEGIGELVVYAREAAADAERRWGVDNAHSAFAFVLRAILEANDVPYDPDGLVEVGGTKQRLDALLDGSIDGTTLHTPFDAIAAANGARLIGGHRTVLRELLTAAVIGARADATSPAVSAYLAALAMARTRLAAGGADAVAAALVQRGWPAQQARIGAEGILQPGGLVPEHRDLIVGMQASIDLRRRFTPGWTPPAPAEHFVAPHPSPARAG